MALRQVELVVVVDDDDLDTTFDQMADYAHAVKMMLADTATVFDIFVTSDLGDVERPA